ncbi:hypothetical protein CROQUDRAFT_579753 [Cronartium quercuum f. sp. fusiforme G11]|uniref:Uncharacterized protein n=1 Tax=Cronartium quercuum f. sp. fusiforme G11 TaxID=708437 RepID=A0A9P6NJM8_9BASI|nr:hypothetical protein CROQUDRAFT_579753 [Cronartium quercuum f. sp. fusiforme G11]
MAITKILGCAVVFCVLGLAVASPTSGELSKRGFFKLNFCAYKDDLADGCSKGYANCCDRCCDKVRTNDMPGSANLDSWNDMCNCKINTRKPSPPSPPPVIPPPVSPPPPPLQAGQSYYVDSVVLHGPAIPTNVMPPNTIAYFAPNPYPQGGNQYFYVPAGLTASAALPNPPSSAPSSYITYYVPASSPSQAQVTTSQVPSVNVNINGHP